MAIPSIQSRRVGDALMRNPRQRHEAPRSLIMILLMGAKTRQNAIWEFLDQDGRFVGPTNIVRINDDDVLRNYLEITTATELASKPDFSSKVDPNCRFIFLPCTTQVEQSQLTADMLRRILSYHQVMPQFLVFLFEFGRKLRIPIARFSGFFSDMVARDPAIAHHLPDVPYMKKIGKLSHFDKLPYITILTLLEAAVWEQTLRIRTDNPMSAEHLGDLQDARRRTTNVLAVLESNQHNMQALSNFYEHRPNMTNNEEISEKQAESCKESIADFLASLGELIHETDMQPICPTTERRNDILASRNELLAKNAEHETVAMRIITVMTLIYLPPTAVSTFFSAGILATNSFSDAADGPTASDGTSASVSTIAAMRNLWLESALPLTFGTGLIAIAWYYYEKDRIIRQGEERQDEGKDAVGAAKAYLIGTLSRFRRRWQGLPK